MTRRKLGRRITVEMSDEMFAAFHSAAEADERTMSSAIRRALRDYITAMGVTL